MSTIQPLEKEHLAAFRKDFQDKEAEITKYISVYLSALAVVTGWIIGPTSKNAVTLFAGNNAYNLVLWFAIVFINIVFSTFLAYKGLIIHDIMQFVTYNAPSTDGLLAWESWRRSNHSSTVRVRTMYTVTIAAIPAVVALIIMGVLFYFLLQPPHTIMTWAKTGAADPATTDPDLQQIARARLIGWTLWAIVLALHAIPLRMFIESIGPTQRRWKELLGLRPDIPRYELLSPHPFATTTAAPTTTINTAAPEPLGQPAQPPLPPRPTPPVTVASTASNTEPAPQLEAIAAAETIPPEPLSTEQEAQLSTTAPLEATVTATLAANDPSRPQAEAPDGPAKAAPAAPTATIEAPGVTINSETTSATLQPQTARRPV